MLAGSPAAQPGATEQIAASHRFLDSLDESRAFVLLARRQHFRAGEHVAMERAAIFFGNARRLLAMFLFTTFATYAALMLLLIPLIWYGHLQGINISPLTFSQADWPIWYAIGYQVVGQVASILLMPVWMLGLSLLYVDERVRHEGYDIELLAARRLGEMPALPAGRVSPLAPALVQTITPTTVISKPEPHHERKVISDLTAPTAK